MNRSGRVFVKQSGAARGFYVVFNFVKQSAAARGFYVVFNFVKQRAAARGFYVVFNFVKQRAAARGFYVIFNFVKQRAAARRFNVVFNFVNDCWDDGGVTFFGRKESKCDSLSSRTSKWCIVWSLVLFDDVFRENGSCLVIGRGFHSVR